MMQLHIIGAGCPDPRRQRFGSAFLLAIGEDQLLIDCGPATTYKMACMGLPIAAVDRLFLTHHHFDHNADVACFALTWWDQQGAEAAKALPVYGPPPTTSFIAKLLGEDGAYFDDWHARIHTPASKRLFERRGGTLPRPQPNIVARDIVPGPVAEGGAWRASAARVHHVEPYLQSVAYRFETDEGSVVFAGDAGACPELDAVCAGADVLVICCAHLNWPTMHADITTCVTGAAEVAEIAGASGAHTVILQHTTGGVDAPGRREAAVSIVSRKFDGRIIFADELTTLDLTRP